MEKQSVHVKGDQHPHPSLLFCHLVFNSTLMNVLHESSQELSAVRVVYTTAGVFMCNRTPYQRMMRMFQLEQNNALVVADGGGSCALVVSGIVA